MNLKLRQTRIIMTSGIVLATFVLVGSVLWFFSNNTIPPANDKQTSEVTKASDAIFVLTDITGDSHLSDVNDRENTYQLSSIDSSSLSEAKIGEVRASIFSHSFAVNQSNELFYVNADGQLAIHHVDTGFTTIVPVPAIKPVFGFFGDTSVKDFLLDGDTVMYFQGGCSDNARCDLKTYDLKTKKSSTILAHLEKKLTIVGETTIDLRSYDPVKKIVTLRKTRNTAANGYADLIEINMKGVDTVVKTVEFTAGTESSPETAAVFTKTLLCGGATATQKVGSDTPNDDAVMQTKILSANGKSITKQPSYIVGCVVAK